MNPHRTIAFIALICGLAIRAAAQDLRGTVRDSASRQPIPAALLLLLDANGATLGRNITSERGTYRVVLSPGMVRLRVVRIGFRPREAVIPAVTDGVATLDIAMQSLPTMLEPVRVTDQTRCPERSDRKAAIALWEQARAGLLATIVARTSQHATVVRLLFNRLLARNSDDIAYQRVRIDSSANAATSFNASRTAEEFVANGFMDAHDGDQVFLAPDAEVLVDDAFARGYCFRLTSPPRERPRTQLGLAFNAVGSRRDRIDIDGTLWIDTAQRAIRDIEFRYVGLDRALDRFRSGGHVGFHEAANGIVFVDRWGLRLIAATPMSPPPSSPVVARATVMMTNSQRLYVQEIGGEVARAAWDDGTTWTAPLGTVRGRVMRDSTTAADGVLVTLHETGYSTRTDSTGRFVISRLLPGPYTVDVADSMFARAGLLQDSSTTFVALRDSTQDLKMQLPSLDEYINNACHARAPRKSVVWVRAVDAEGRPVSDVHVVPSYAQIADGPWTELPIAATGNNGQLMLCDANDYKPLPTRGILHLEAKDSSLASDTVEIVLDPEVRLMTALLHVRPKR